MALEDALDLLACPRCGTAFNPVPGAVRCTSGHSYDLARQGYLNLSSAPEPANADTPAMLAARDRVHAADLFETVAHVVRDRLDGRPRVLEVGSGTAYYLRFALGDDETAVGVALDVSKAAARLAARADPRITAVVADVWRPLPIRDHSLDGVLCVFAPRNLAEFARVLRPDGRLVVVTPKPDHLAGLRDRHGLLHIPAGKADQLATAAAEFFETVSVTGLTRTREVRADLVADLVAMGPNAFHRLPQDVVGSSVTIAVTIQTFTPLSH